MCSGSVVAPQWVLSAKHCMLPGPGKMTVAVGNADRGAGELIEVAEKHSRHDLLLLKLVRPAANATPVMLAEYVPPDFELQQRKSAEEALAIIAKEVALGPERVSAVVRQGGIYQEILDEAKAIGADLIVMSSHRTGVRTYFLGSEAGHVVRYATCSVLVVRR